LQVEVEKAKDPFKPIINKTSTEMALTARKKIEGSESMTKLEWLTRPTRGQKWENKTKADQFLQEKTTFTFKPKISDYVASAVIKEPAEGSPETPKKSSRRIMPHSGSKCLDLFYYAKQL
jgi:hypothetical protein